MRLSKKEYTQDLNFLKSHHYVTFTGTGTQAMATDGVVKAGTVYPSDDANAKGIVLHSVNVVDGDQPVAVMVEGHVYEDRLEVSEAAKTALKNIGFH